RSRAPVRDTRPSGRRAVPASMPSAAGGRRHTVRRQRRATDPAATAGRHSRRARRAGDARRSPAYRTPTGGQVSQRHLRGSGLATRVWQSRRSRPSGDGETPATAGLSNALGAGYTAAAVSTVSEAITRARILIVDDQAANIRLLERLLTSAGYNRIHATTHPVE